MPDDLGFLFDEIEQQIETERQVRALANSVLEGCTVQVGSEYMQVVLAEPDLIVGVRHRTDLKAFEASTVRHDHCICVQHTTLALRKVTHGD